MTLLEFYEQFCKHYREENTEALITLFQEPAELLFTDIVIFKTQEAYYSRTIEEHSTIAYISDTQVGIINTIYPATVIEDKENLFLKMLMIKAIVLGDMTFLNKFKLDRYLSVREEQIICGLLNTDDTKALLIRSIQDGTVHVMHAVLKQFLLKSQGVLDLSEPLVEGLTTLELLAQNGNGPKTRFNKKMMLFYAACWDYFVGEMPTIENIHRLPCVFPLDQPHANIKLFLESDANGLSDAMDNPFFSSVGLCVGLSHLYDYYASRGRSDYYLMTIALLKLWWGDEAQLTKPLPAILPQSLFYKTLYELFRQWTNDILVFHSTLIDAHVLRPQIEYENQLPMARFDLVKPKEEETTRLVLIENKMWKFGSYGTAEQFTEYLTYLTQIPHTYIAFGQHDHHTSISTLEGKGQTIYFDPGDIRDCHKLRQVGYSQKDSVKALEESITAAHPEWDNYNKSRGVLVYRYDGPAHKKPWAESSIFSEDDLPKTPVAAHYFQLVSPNQLTHLHVAILVQDIETAKKILTSGVVDVSAKDIYERNAIDIAVGNGYWEGAKLLLDDPRIPSFVLSRELRNILILYEREDFIIQLIQHEKVYYGSLVDLLEMSMQANRIKIIDEMKKAFAQNPQKLRDLLLTSVKIFFGTQKEELAKELFIFMVGNIGLAEYDDLLNGIRVTHGCPEERATVLHRAILERDYAFVEFLLEKGADINISIQGGPYDGKTALQLLRDCGKLELIPEDKRKLTEKAEIRAKRVYTFFEETDRRFAEMNRRIDRRINEYFSNLFVLRP